MVFVGLVGLVGVGVLLSRGSKSSATEGAPASSQASPLLAPLPTSSSAGAKSAPLTDQERDQLAGNYTCQIDDTATFPCRVSGGVLEKLGGSQRFKGPITKLSNGSLAFSGSFFCPSGDCTHPVAATFIRQSAGHYVGHFGKNDVPGGGPGGERVVLVKVR